MTQNTEIKVKVVYGKAQQSRYIAHLDTIDIILKALRRLRLPYVVTQGCHVRPKISCGSPLPLGHASRCEQFVLSLSEAVDANWLKTELSHQLPNGMDVMEVEIPCPDEKKGANGDMVKYHLGFTSPETTDKTEAFLKNPESKFSIMSKGKMKDYQLGNALQSFNRFVENQLSIIEAEFIQGKPDVPSVSKILTALSDYLGEAKDDLVLIERVSIQKL